jgi:hypothetical protein
VLNAWGNAPGWARSAMVQHKTYRVLPKDYDGENVLLFPRRRRVADSLKIGCQDGVPGWEGSPRGGHTARDCAFDTRILPHFPSPPQQTNFPRAVRTGGTQFIVSVASEGDARPKPMPCRGNSGGHCPPKRSRQHRKYRKHREYRERTGGVPGGDAGRMLAPCQGDFGGHWYLQAFRLPSRAIERHRLPSDFRLTGFPKGNARGDSAFPRRRQPSHPTAFDDLRRQPTAIDAA